MSAPTAYGAETPAAGPGRRRGALLGAVLADVVTAAAWFAVTGAVAGAIWAWAASPVDFARTADGLVMDELQLSRQVYIDVWFGVIAMIAGFLSGLVLPLWRRRDPVLTVVLVAAGGILATWLMKITGIALGPGDPAAAAAGAAVGDTVPAQLAVTIDALWSAWPVMGLLAAVGLLWGLGGDDDQPSRRDVLSV